jgi:rubrerythrin
MKPLETNVEEVLREAIQSEIETRAYYQAMSLRTGEPAVRKRMLELADLELVHRAKHERRYRELIGQAPPEPKPVTVDLPPDIINLDMGRALKLALERERDSESYYRFMAERVPATTELGKLFVELAEMEWKHKTELQAEYDSTIMADPEEFLLDI